MKPDAPDVPLPPACVEAAPPGPQRIVWLALGANVGGTWGKPSETLDRVLLELERLGCRVVARSDLYATAPMGRKRQPNFLNSVIGVTVSAGPAALLRMLKQLERQAGRRSRGHWDPRPLDIDILDYGGRMIGGACQTRIGRPLQLPHPGIASRGFVLVPLAEVAPAWRHPRLGCGASDLLRRQSGLRRGVLRVDTGCEANSEGT